MWSIFDGLNVDRNLVLRGLDGTCFFSSGACVGR